MQSLSEAIPLYAELAIALAGFTGVAAAFAGRERAFRPTELTRLQGVLGTSAAVLAGCLAFYSTKGLELTEQVSQSVVALASLLVTIYLLAVTIPFAWRSKNDPDSTAGIGALATVTTVMSGIAFTYLLAALAWVGPGMILVAFSAQLLIGLWMFVRLLTRPN